LPFILHYTCIYICNYEKIHSKFTNIPVFVI
jgi:hypothetical protein